MNTIGHNKLSPAPNILKRRNCVSFGQQKRNIYAALKEDFSNLPPVKKFNSQSHQKKFEITCIGGLLSSLVLCFILNLILLKNYISTINQPDNSEGLNMSPPIKSVRRNNDNKNSLVKKPGFKYQGAGLAERGTFISFSDTGAYETNLKISQSMFEANNEVIEKGGINPEDIRGFKAYVNFNASNPVSLYSPSYKKNSDKSEIFLVISSKIKDFDGTDTNVTSCAGNLKDVFILEYGQFLYNQNRLSYKEMSDVWKKYVNPELKRDIKKFLSIAATEHISVNGKNVNGGKYVGEFFAGAVTGKVHLTDKQGKKRTECDFTPTKEMIKLYVALKGPAIPNILQGYVPGEPYDVDKEFEAGHINLKIGE